jgi:hypothetical protein
MVFLFFFLAAPASRIDLGLPLQWSQIEGWLCCTENIWSLDMVNNTVNTGSSEDATHQKTVDWDSFLTRPIPKEALSRINVENLEKLVAKYEKKLLESEVSRAKRVISYLRNGAPAHQKQQLGSCYVENRLTAGSSYPALLKVMEDWLEKGFIAGPFKEPPLDHFRVNGMIAITKGNKTRPVLNVSEPAGRSFNDNVDITEVEKVYMDSAKSFSFSLLEAGKGARLDKTDVKDAFKNIPARVDDL